jgi:uncharacterized protein YggT (Ycf19 family)
LAGLVVVLKGLVEFAGLLLLARGAVFMISFGRHEQNPIYQFLRFLTRPLLTAARLITPSFIVDRHLPAVAVFLLLCCWIALIVLKALTLPGGGA